MSPNFRVSLAQKLGYEKFVQFFDNWLTVVIRKKKKEVINKGLFIFGLNKPGGEYKAGVD